MGIAELSFTESHCLLLLLLLETESMSHSNIQTLKMLHESMLNKLVAVKSFNEHLYVKKIFDETKKESLHCLLV